MITLITGGVKAGKSSRALEIVRNEWQIQDLQSPVAFIATAELTDKEMELRIARHRQERALLRSDNGALFVTIEEALELGRAISAAGNRGVVDCIPMWVNNLMYHKRENDFPLMLDAVITGLRIGYDWVIVTNETGMGNIPFDVETRRYNLLLAEANRKIAAIADRVELMVSGIPLRVKG
jgi:adenosylcobinamide kinase/adenosylcobinamide-phosphate guanylyltransferase